jgi:D-tyrosyl-tRNA(Tyr) deacylase
VLNVKLSEPDEDVSRVSVLDMPGSVLIIPQATLGGKMKGKMVQYHKNIQKDKGLEYFNKFIDLCKKYANENEKWTQNNCKIEAGTYGIRQVYSTQTNGPFLHLIEF